MPKQSAAAKLMSEQSKAKADKRWKLLNQDKQIAALTKENIRIEQETLASLQLKEEEVNSLRASIKDLLASQELLLESGKVCSALQEDLLDAQAEVSGLQDLLKEKEDSIQSLQSDVEKSKQITRDIAISPQTSSLKSLDKDTADIVRQHKREEKLRASREEYLSNKVSASALKVKLIEAEKAEEVLKARALERENALLHQLKRNADSAVKKAHDRERIHIKRRLSEEAQRLAQEKENAELKEKVRHLEQLVEKYVKDSGVETIDGGVFTDQIRLVYYMLITLNIATSKIEEIIRTVLHAFAPNVTVGKLPSVTTANEFRKECVGLAYQQVSEMLGGEGAHKFQTVGIDEASKQRQGMVATVQTTLVDGKRVPLVLGLKRTFKKTAAGGLEDFKGLLELIRSVNEKRLGVEGALRQLINLLEYTRNTQTDRGASVLKWATELFPAFRSTMLQLHKEGWGDLSEAEMKVLNWMVAHDCCNHFWHNVGVQASKGLAMWEATHFAEEAAKTRSGGYACQVEDALWAIMKDIAERASEQSGFGAQVVRDWMDNFTEKDFKSANFKAQLGNRFNVLSENSRGVYHLAPELRRFYDGKFNLSSAY